ncbi:MAG: uncharacterized protein QOH57_2541 [Mycobacterium sp.]|jgi:hypothetical protein|nr:uncharacterized protein [Mycobacterium sp.]
MSRLDERINGLNWDGLRATLDDRGYVVTPQIFGARECRDLVRLFEEHSHFRKVIDMSRYRYGSGTYKYFDTPLPTPVQQLRRSLYEPLAAVANDWGARLSSEYTYPETLDEFVEVCHRRGQNRPTPLIFRYGEGDYNALHQDVYGTVGFPFQALVALSRADTDYTGGEFLLVTQRPRAQSVGEAIELAQGQVLIFPNQHRPMPSTRGYYRANVRHGVSRVNSGTRHTLGIIFHDAE